MIGLDHRVQRWVVEHRVGWLNGVFEWVSNLGALGWIFVVIAAVAAIALRRPLVLLLTLAALGVGELLERGLKEAVDRPRPHLPPGDPQPLVKVPSNPSFPSGHATLAFAGAVTIALLVPRLAVPVLVLATAIAYSRVYLGVHYPLDVLGGAAIGAAVAIALHRLATGRIRPRLRRKGG